MAPRRGDLPPSAFIERKSASRASSFDDLERNFDARDADRKHQRQGQTPYLTHPSQKFDNRQPDTTQSKRIQLEEPMSHTALRLAGITKRYRSNTVLGPIDLSLEEGRIYGLIGENGAGKSTFIRIAMGLSKPTGGTVELMGQRGQRACGTRGRTSATSRIRARAIRCSALPTTSRYAVSNGGWTSARFRASLIWSGSRMQGESGPAASPWACASASIWVSRF